MSKYTISLHHPEGRTDLIQADTLRELIVAMRSLGAYIHNFDRLQGATAPSPSRLCPLHRVPFRLYKFGWAHPPMTPGDNWCKEAELTPVEPAVTAHK